AGDDTFGAAQAEGSYGVGRGTLRLELTAQGGESTGEGIAIAVEACGAGVPESVRVALRVDDRPAGELETGPDGEAQAILPRAVLGRPGEKLIVARFAGSSQLNPAEASATALLTTSTRIADLEAPDRPVPFERDVTVRGRLLEDDGANGEGDGGGAGAGAPVSLARGATTAEPPPAARGRFDLRLAGSTLGPGPAALTVEHVSRVPWRRGTRVGPLSVVVLAPRPIPLIYPVGALAAACLAVVAYVLLRTRPWERLLVRWRRRRRKPEAAPPPELAADESVAPGLKLARPGLISTLRRPTDFGFTGRVSDAVRGHAVPAARLTATCGAEEVVGEADGAGHF